MCLSRKEHEALLSRMDKDNRNLKNLTKDSLDLEPVRLNRRKGSEPFRKIRDCARSLHNVLRHGWSCTCKIPHRANLRLETRDCDSTPSFRVLFPTTSELPQNDPNPTFWQETDFRPIGDDKDARGKPNDSQPTDEFDTKLAAGLASLTMTASKTHMAIISSTVQLSIGMPLTDHTNIPLSRKTNLNHFKKKVGRAADKADDVDCHRIKNKMPSDSDSLASQSPIPVVDPGQALIEDLCHALSQIQSTERRETCVGRLVDKELSLVMYAVGQQPPTSSGASTTTLHDLLGHDNSSMQPQPGLVTFTRTVSLPYMTKKQRLQIAVTLASTALQLQTTEWLNSEWGKGDILFHNGQAEQPFISQVFQRDHLKVEQPKHTGKHASFSPVRNESVFKLGVLLLELSYGKPIEYFQSADDPPYFTEYAIAKRLVEDLAEEEASGYADAARACIFCDFGTKVKVPSLDNEAFRQAVYDDVVIPLEDEWKHWNRKSG